MLHNRGNEQISLALAAGAGIGAFALPLVSPWYLVLLFVPACAGFFSEKAPRNFWIAICVVFLFATLLGVVPAPISVATLAAIILIPNGHFSVGAMILLLQTSLTATAESELSDLLHAFQVEAAAPSFLAIAMLWAARIHLGLAAISATVVSLAVAWVARNYLPAPQQVVFFASLPACAFAAYSATRMEHYRWWPPVAVPAAFWAIALLSW